MCSSPKGGSTKPLLSSQVDSLSGDMTSAEYTNMVQRANESYEHRQKELKEYRRTHKNKLSSSPKKHTHASFFEKLMAFFSQNRSSGQLESK